MESYNPNPAVNRLQGGAETIQSLMDELKSWLDIARSPQSGAVTLDGSEQTIYEESDTKPFMFHGCKIDFTGSSWAAGESVTVKVYAKVKSGGTYHLIDAPAAIVALPAPAIRQFPTTALQLPLLNVYGLKITVQQAAVAGGWHVYDHESFDAKRGS